MWCARSRRDVRARVPLNFHEGGFRKNAQRTCRRFRKKADVDPRNALAKTLQMRRGGLARWPGRYAGRRRSCYVCAMGCLFDVSCECLDSAGRGFERGHAFDCHPPRYLGRLRCTYAIRCGIDNFFIEMRLWWFVTMSLHNVFCVCCKLCNLCDVHTC